VDSRNEKRKTRGTSFKGASGPRFRDSVVKSTWGAALQADLRSRLVHKCSLLVAIGRRTLTYKRRLSIPENSHSPERFVPAMTCLLLYFYIEYGARLNRRQSRSIGVDGRQRRAPSRLCDLALSVSPAYRGWLCARPGAKEIVKHQALCTATLEATACSLRHWCCPAAICR
jgi:hypothetical protein